MRARLMVAVAVMVALAACGGKEDRPPRGQGGRPGPPTQVRRPTKTKPVVMKPVQAAPTMTAERIREKKSQVRVNIRGLMAQIDGELHR